MIDATINFKGSGAQPWPEYTEIFTTRSLALAAYQLDHLLRDKDVLPLSRFLRDETLPDSERGEMGFPPVPDEWFDCREGLKTMDALIVALEQVAPSGNYVTPQTFASGPADVVRSDLRTAKLILELGAVAGERFRMPFRD